MLVLDLKKKEPVKWISYGLTDIVPAYPKICTILGLPYSRIPVGFFSNCLSMQCLTMLLLENSVPKLVNNFDSSGLIFILFLNILDSLLFKTASSLQDFEFLKQKWNFRIKIFKTGHSAPAWGRHSWLSIFVDLFHFLETFFSILQDSDWRVHTKGSAEDFLFFLK